VALPESTTVGEVITATATRASSSETSEFSACAAVQSACLADIESDNALNFLDVSAFLVMFGKNDPAADFTNDGQFNFLDVSAFLAAYASGCP
jgi:hypothetical protein